MSKLDPLRQRANELLQSSIDNEKEHRKFEIIANTLKNEECFLDMDIEHAYAILRDLGVNEDSLRSYYSSLIEQ